MKINETPIPGLLVIEPKVFEDNRGYFYECYNETEYQQAGIKARWIQDNQSKSGFGVLRGLHYQLDPWSQSKLVRVLEGEILDVAVDIRKGSPTYKKWFSIKLSGENKKQFFIPKGFAHGFSVLSPVAVVFYKCDQFYKPESERGILFNDPELDIDWGIESKHILLSAKDKIHPLLKDAENNFVF